MGKQARNYSQKTIKRLFALSGNQCAFSNCIRILVNQNNALDSNICHIEAAEPKGQRYNPNMTDQERADYNNLILLCPIHHDETNDTTKYTVNVLQNMKKSHEQRIRERIEYQTAYKSDVDTLNAFMEYIPFHHLEWYCKNLPNTIDEDFFILNNLYDDFIKDFRASYPLNNESLQTYFNNFLNSYFHLVDILFSYSIEHNTLQYTNYIQSDTCTYIQMNKKFLSYENIKNLNQEVITRKNIFINNYVEFINFLRVNYLDIYIKGETYIG
jgi:hypothetical protein